MTRVRLNTVQPKCIDRGGRWGNRKGIPNKSTTLLKDAILYAAEAVGEDGKGKDGLIGYLVGVAKKHPKAYCRLLARVLPYHLTSDLPIDPVTAMILAEVMKGPQQQPTLEGHNEKPLH